VFDEMVDNRSVAEESGGRRRTNSPLLPQTSLRRSKRQLRSAAYQAIEAAIAGSEPLLDGWLSEETIQATAAVLARKG